MSDSNKILIIDGARQIGKSYIIRYVGNKFFSNYIEINLLEDSLLKDKNIVNVRTIQSEIHEYYKIDASKYDKENKLKIRRIYDLIPSTLENENKSKRYRKYKEKKFIKIVF